jgi:hypothetical protein
VVGLYHCLFTRECVFVHLRLFKYMNLLIFTEIDKDIMLLVAIPSYCLVICRQYRILQQMGAQTPEVGS